MNLTFSNLIIPANNSCFFFCKNKPASLVLLCCFSLFYLLPGAQARAAMMEAMAPKNGKEMAVGVARIDVTPEGPSRLAGYGDRKTESEGVLQPLGAKALALGDGKGVSVLLTVDLIGIPGHITSRLYERLAKKAGLDSANVVICTSHTHGGPEVGTLLNHFGEPLPPEQ